jgi:hypothetical protein
MLELFVQSHAPQALGVQAAGATNEKSGTSAE